MDPIKQYYNRLSRAFGPQHWWPGDTPFEVIVGAILTQNTAWANVEKAIGNLKKESLLTPRGIHGISVKKLAGLIRPSGYFNIKARRLKNFSGFLFRVYAGDLRLMFRTPWKQLRKELLGVNGIGPETADSILLYAGGLPVFVVDLYTRRVFARHGLVDFKAPYNTIQKVFMDRLPARPRIFNEYHALVVRIGKEFCGAKPKCRACPLEGFLEGKNPVNSSI